MSTAMLRDHAHALQARFVAGLAGTGLDPACLVVPLEGRAGATSWPSTWRMQRAGGKG